MLAPEKVTAVLSAYNHSGLGHMATDNGAAAMPMMAVGGTARWTVTGKEAAHDGKCLSTVGGLPALL